MREKGKGGMREMPQREKDYIETEKRERKRKREDKGAASRDKLESQTDGTQDRSGRKGE